MTLENKCLSAGLIRSICLTSLLQPEPRPKTTYYLCFTATLASGPFGGCTDCFTPKGTHSLFLWWKFLGARTIITSYCCHWCCWILNIYARHNARCFRYIISNPLNKPGNGNYHPPFIEAKCIAQCHEVMKTKAWSSFRSVWLQTWAYPTTPQSRQVYNYPSTFYYHYY